MKHFSFGFSFHRFWAIVVKEFIQMRRDRMTFGMMVGIPLLQLTLFGFAINADPKHLATAVYVQDDGPFGRRLVSAIQKSGYFDILGSLQSEAEVQSALLQGKVQFVLSIPVDFSRRLLRGEIPNVLMEADATDPAATGNAVSALRVFLEGALKNELQGSLSYLARPDAPVELRVHSHYNPEGITQYNIVPGLMGVVLTMTMVVITSLAITRERETGTMENLLSMPTQPLEVLIGKIIPYIFVGYIQVFLILIASRFLFTVPMVGSLALLMSASLLFIAANLAMGITLSTIAQNQRQAMQMAMFYFLPSMLLSGFMFPFRGMPIWAQRVGEVLPITHFLRIVRGILLKGSTLADISGELWPILLFSAIAIAIGVTRYCQTLD